MKNNVETKHADSAFDWDGFLVITSVCVPLCGSAGGVSCVRVCDCTLGCVLTTTEAALRFPGNLSANPPKQSPPVGGVSKHHSCEKCGSSIV